MQQGQDRRAETSAAIEVVGVEGDEGTEAGTSLEVSLSMANKSKEYPVANPNEREPVIKT